MNELIVYMLDLYIAYYMEGKEPDSSNLKEDNTNDIAKAYYCYALDLMLSGLYPEGYQIMMQSYYETKMASLVSVENVQDIRIQMLFVFYGVKLLHEGNRERFLEVANQFASNKLFDVSYYKKILLEVE